MTTLTIGDLAVRTGSNVPTIRYYEEIGVLPPADRLPSGHRVYDQSDLKRLTFIRHCRDFGFSIDQVRRLIDLAATPERDCNEARLCGRGAPRLGPQEAGRLEIVGAE